MKRILFLTLALSLLLTACGGASSPAPAPTMAISDPARQLDATAGGTFKLMLNSNPTTGYHWEIVGALDETVVKFVSKDYKSTSEPGLVGGGGVDVWTFQAVGAGETTITLGYYPPSNNPVDPEQTQTFTVKVK